MGILPQDPDMQRHVETRANSEIIARIKRDSWTLERRLSMLHSFGSRAVRMAIHNLFPNLLLVCGWELPSHPKTVAVQPSTLNPHALVRV